MAPTATSDRVCPALNVCGADQYESTAPTATSDRVCKSRGPCTAYQYESTAPTATSDRECKAVTVCPANQYESAAPTATSDRGCTAVTVCTANQYESAAPTATSDRVCKATDVAVFDGCKKSGEAPVPQVVSPTSKKLASTPRGATSSTIATRCCRGEGASLQCASSTASGCLPKGADYASSARACEMIGTGWGLCTQAQLLTGKCCGTGCNYDQHYTLTADTPQATSP